MSDENTPAATVDDIPTVTLGGLRWTIPRLTLGRWLNCRAAFLELNARITNAILLSPAPDGADKGARFDHNLTVITETFAALSDDDFQRLVLNVLVAAIPGLTAEALDAMPADNAELQLAWLTARVQSGLFSFNAEIEGTAA